MISATRKTLLLLLPLAAASGCAIQMDERSLIQPVAAGPLSPELLAQVAPGLSLEPHSITTSDGIRLSAVLLRQPGADLTILYFGGNRFTVGKVGPAAARLLGPLKANLLLVDYRGYGLSQGVPTAANLASDGLEVFDYLAALPGMSADRIVVHGQSLGSSIAGHVAAERATAGAVLESSITTMEEWVGSQAGGMRVQIAPSLSGQGNSRNVTRIDEPLLILVGAGDTTTPPQLSRALYRLSPLPAARKTLSIVAGAGHNDVLAQPATSEIYRAFLASLR